MCKPSEAARVSSRTARQDRKKRELEFLTELTSLRVEHEDLQRKYDALELRNKRLESHIRSSIRKCDSPAECNTELCEQVSEESGTVCTAFAERVLMEQPVVERRDTK